MYKITFTFLVTDQGNFTKGLCLVKFYVATMLNCKIDVTLKISLKKIMRYIQFLVDRIANSLQKKWRQVFYVRW